MKHCRSTRDRFSAYLDGALTGVSMQQVVAHLDSCAECRHEFAGWRTMQSALGALGPAKAPPELALRLRVAISQEQSRTPRETLARLRVRWQNTMAPFLLRASAGLASAVLLLGTAAVLIGAFATPEPVEARDAPPNAATSPRFLYSMIASSTPGAYDSHVAGAREVSAQRGNQPAFSVFDDCLQHARRLRFPCRRSEGSQRPCLHSPGNHREHKPSGCGSLRQSIRPRV